MPTLLPTFEDLNDLTHDEVERALHAVCPSLTPFSFTEGTIAIEGAPALSMNWYVDDINTLPGLPEILEIRGFQLPLAHDVAIIGSAYRRQTA